MIYLIPHGHVIVSFLNRIIIVSRGVCPSATFFKYREDHYPIPFFWGGGENDQIKSASRWSRNQKIGLPMPLFHKVGKPNTPPYFVRWDG